MVAKALGRLSAGWAGRTGATVAVVAASPDADAAADIVVLAPAELGAWAARGDARPLPAALEGEDHALRWPRVLSPYRDRLAMWGGRPRAVPLAGDGYALVYRADKLAGPKYEDAFRAKFGRPPAPPATWEAAAEVAEFFADADGKPSLPPLASDAGRLLREFHFVAACYDRQPLPESAIRGAGLQTLSFHFDAVTGRPRLAAPAFVAAAEFLRRVNRCRMPGPSDDPVTALDTGTAVLAVLTLAEVGRLPKDGDTVSARFGVAQLPGTQMFFDAAGKTRPPTDRARAVNYVPYFGSGGWLGVVRARCESPEAAFELLADLASPARSLDPLSDPALGFGPFRAEHLEQQREAVWQRYDLDPARTQRLVEGLRLYMAATVANPVFAYRGPDQEPLMTELAKHVRAAATGGSTPADAMKAADDAWRKRDASQPPDKLAEWRRKSAGLE
jgi:ABC-type glycerol-3-phosphate transport system substrate-binding protein